ncbi:general substrate transporter [Aspergillus egyptiacus]|nr:general substrate transporter [Aspergillus egyptiacus]
MRRRVLDRSRWPTPPFFAFVVLTIACGSIPKGYDEGGYSASVRLDSFKADFNLHPSNWTHNTTELANRTANITSLNVLGAALGALISLDLNDRLGRLRSWRLSCMIWTSGTFIQVFSSGAYGLLLFARIWAGLGAGALTVVTPLYLSEIAPARTRGLVVSIYMVILLATLTLGFFINYAASIHMPAARAQYRLVQSIPLIPVGAAFFASFTLPETPRYLVAQHREDDALDTLARLRGTRISLREIKDEFSAIARDARLTEADTRRSTNWQAFKETQLNPNYRQRFWLLMAMQTVAQWTGGNGITYYVSGIFESAGVTGTATSLVSSGAYGIVKLVFTMAFTWGLIDYLGRRRCALLGLSLQIVAHIYLASYMGALRRETSSDPAGTRNKPASNAAIASIFIYAVGWSIGLCTIPYLYGTEIFPTRIRNVSYAVSMSAHWLFQFAVVRVTPNMLVSLHDWGAYLFWATICFIGLLVLGTWMPETKGVPIERMGELFDGPWYWRWRAKLKDEDTS